MEPNLDFLVSFGNAYGLDNDEAEAFITEYCQLARIFQAEVDDNHLVRMTRVADELGELSSEWG